VNSEAVNGHENKFLAYTRDEVSLIQASIFSDQAPLVNGDGNRQDSENGVTCWTMSHVSLPNSCFVLFTCRLWPMLMPPTLFSFFILYTHRVLDPLFGYRSRNTTSRKHRLILLMINYDRQSLGF